MGRQRIIVVDVSHLFYKYAFGGATNLSTTLRVGGVLQQVDTTLPNYVIKQIHRWSGGGYDPIVVCFDGKGSTRSRKAYFAKANGLVSGVEEPQAQGYKGKREVQSDRFYQGVNITMNLLMKAGVCCLKADGYEADDLVKAVVDKAKREHPSTPIDVFTGDVDLAPLVDEQVSVYLNSRKMTWAEAESLERLHYVQLCPKIYQEYIEGLTDYKKLSVPYNSVLLSKLLRGDKSDELKGYPKFTPTKYNKLIESMESDGVDFRTLFRYDSPTATVCYRGTGERIPDDVVDRVPREEKMIKFGEPPLLTQMCEVLSKYLDESIINHVRFIYNGINLNGAFTGLTDGFNRRPAVMKAEIKGYDQADLQQAVSVLQIRLPIL